ncbi:MAG: prolyl-tRNA synthetase associated domain-containing protein [Pseudomonadota bacterium]
MSPEEQDAEARLRAFFAEHALPWHHHSHPPLFTVEDSRSLRGDIPGAHVKNMFLKEKKGGLWLVTCLEDRRVRIRDLEKAMGARGCSFAKPELLWQTLGVRPGAVTPFAALQAGPEQIRVVLDRDLSLHGEINAHPLHNRATLTISYENLIRFLHLTGHDPFLVDFAALERTDTTSA